MKKLYVSNGNIKVKCSIFNLPCKKTCKPGLQCAKYCYAQKAEKMYPSVKPCRENNLEHAKQDSFIDEMVELLSKRRSEHVRVHESGDFFSWRYICNWYLIALKMPDKTFYAYTKRNDLFTEELLKLKPDNFILIYSVDGIQDNLFTAKIPKGFDKIAYVTEDISTCPAQTDDNIKCMKDCKKCIDKKTKIIIFKKH